MKVLCRRALDRRRDRTQALALPAAGFRLVEHEAAMLVAVLQRLEAEAASSFERGRLIYHVANRCSAEFYNAAFAIGRAS